MRQKVLKPLKIFFNTGEVKYYPSKVISMNYNVDVTFECYCMIY